MYPRKYASKPRSMKCDLFMTNITDGERAGERKRFNKNYLTEFQQDN